MMFRLRRKLAGLLRRLAYSLDHSKDYRRMWKGNYWIKRQVR